MCCLFGLIDTRLRFSGKQKSKMLHALATVSEVRGTDATGIAYHTGEQLCIYKRPIPGHKLKFYMRDDTRVGMGHTRMTTQGKASKNRNNHPFRGIIRNEPFALAHNGVLYNDLALRRNLGLPKTRIETDSYIGVQLIEQKGSLDFSSLRYMAEQVEGSFTFTVLDAEDSLYIVKGDNPFCLYYFPRCGLYLYASTEEILCHAINDLGLCEYLDVLPLTTPDLKQEKKRIFKAASPADKREACTILCTCPELLENPTPGYLCLLLSLFARFISYLPAPIVCISITVNCGDIDVAPEFLRVVLSAINGPVRLSGSNFSLLRPSSLFA